MAALRDESESEEGRFLACARRLIENHDYRVIGEILERHRLMKEAEVSDILAGHAQTDDINKARYFRGYADGILFALTLPEKILKSETPGVTQNGQRRD